MQHLVEQLNKDRKSNGELCNGIIRCGQNGYKVHQSIVCAASDVFKSKFSRANDKRRDIEQHYYAAALGKSQDPIKACSFETISIDVSDLISGERLGIMLDFIYGEKRAELCDGQMIEDAKALGIIDFLVSMLLEEIKNREAQEQDSQHKVQGIQSGSFNMQQSTNIENSDVKDNVFGVQSTDNSQRSTTNEVNLGDNNNITDSNTGTQKIPSVIEVRGIPPGGFNLQQSNSIINSNVEGYVSDLQSTDNTQSTTGVNVINSDIEHPTEGQQDAGTEPHKAVQIIQPGYSGMMQFNEKEFSRVFGQVGDLPIAVYSMTGATRSGKSFVMNVLLQLLWYHKRGESRKWLENKEDQLSKGFSWEGGSANLTKGVWVWDEPFIVTTPTGEVAIFLMDVQGFDNSTSFGEWSTILAFVTMISSIQIYNIQHMHDDTIKYLKLSTEYGEARAEKPFQNFLFLVRDWSDPGVSFGIGGGSQVLNRFFYSEFQHKDLASVQKNLYRSYKVVSCFLLPHPGAKLAVRDKRNGRFIRCSEVDKSFTQQAQQLFRHLFSSTNVVTKRMNGEVLTGRSLTSFMSAYFNVLGSRSMPMDGSLMEVTKNATSNIVEHCVDTYTKQMGQVFKHLGFIESELLREKHKICMDVALRQYDEFPKLGDESFVQDYRRQLTKLIDQKFSVYQRDLEKRDRTYWRDPLSDVVRKAGWKYDYNIPSISMEHILSSAKLQEAHASSYVDALDFYEEECAKLVGDSRKALLEDLEERFEQLKMRNENARENRRRREQLPSCFIS